MTEYRVSYVGGNSPAAHLVAQLEADGSVLYVAVRSDDLELAPSAEALAAAAMFAAMRNHASLRVDGLLDGRFLGGIESIAGMHRQWDPTLGELMLESAGQADVAGSGSRVALFFSGGVDSFYSLVENEAEITDLIFVHGFDITPGSRDLAAEAHEWVLEVGRAFNKRVIRIDTNLRGCLFDPHCSWGLQGHGAAMAFVAHLLGGDFKRVLFAGSDSRQPYVAWGTHPDLDPCWSTQRLEISHDHCGVERIDKIRRLATVEIARRTLRVCWKNRNGHLNCGRCEKCLRTMLTLKGLGMLDDFRVFAEPLRWRRVLAMTIPPVGHACYSVEHNLELLSREPGCAVTALTLRLALMRRSLAAWLNFKRKERSRRFR